MDRQLRLLYALFGLRRVQGVRVAAKVSLDSGRERQCAQDRSQNLGGGARLALAHLRMIAAEAEGTFSSVSLDAP
jgi:hypothetical protein